MRFVQLFLWIIPLALAGQSAIIPNDPPADLPKGAQRVAKAWHAALLKDDYKVMVHLGGPFLNQPHQSKDGGRDLKFFRGYTHFAKFALAEPSSQAALDSILKAYQQLPDQGEICYQAGHALLKRNRAAEAVRPLEDAVRIYPFPDARVDLAVAWNGSGRHKEALESLQLLDQAFPDHRRIRFEMAHCLVSLNRPGEALPILQQLVQKDAKDVGALQELAYVLTELKRPAEAVPHLRAAVGLVPKDPAPWVELVEAYMSLGRKAEAQKAAVEAERRGASPALMRAVNLRIQR